MKTLIIIALSLILVAVATGGQPTRPSDIQDGTTCESKAVKHLIAATDPMKRTDQEWNLLAAEAYDRLAEKGFQEC